MNWRFWKPAPAISIRAINPKALDMVTWRKNPQLVADTADFLKSGLGVALLDMLHATSPINFVSNEFGVTTEDRAFRLAKIEGYHICLSKIIHAGEPMPEIDSTPLKATFAPPEQ